MQTLRLDFCDFVVFQRELRNDFFCFLSKSGLYSCYIIFFESIHFNVLQNIWIFLFCCYRPKPLSCDLIVSQKPVTNDAKDVCVCDCVYIVEFACLIFIFLVFGIVKLLIPCKKNRNLPSKKDSLSSIFKCS